MLEEGADGRIRECATLDAADLGREAWDVAIRHHADRVIMTMGNYAADLASVSDRPHEFHGTDRHGATGRFVDVWLWTP